MANSLFVSFRNGILGSHATYVDLDGDTVSAIFVDHADDTPSVAADDFMDDIASAAQVPVYTSGPALASKTIGSVGDGVFDAADTTFSSLTGDQSESLVIFKDTGTDTTSNLIAYWDTATGLPLTPNGGDVTVAWNASGILSV